MRPSNNPENKILSDRLNNSVCMKVQGHSSLEPLLEYNQNQMSLTHQG